MILEEARDKGMKKILYWAPRVLSILFAIFISLFALDVFDGDHSFWETLLALLIHLIPVYILVGGLILAWRWPWIGAILYFALAILYVVLTGGRQHWSAYVGISLPLIVISLLWFVNWILRDEFVKK